MEPYGRLKTPSIIARHKADARQLDSLHLCFKQKNPISSLVGKQSCVSLGESDEVLVVGVDVGELDVDQQQHLTHTHTHTKIFKKKNPDKNRDTCDLL